MDSLTNFGFVYHKQRDIHKVLEIEHKIKELNPIEALKQVSPDVPLDTEQYLSIEKLSRQIQQEIRILVSCITLFN